ncbi:MAG: hypothetical protein IPP51_02340 [Bacteroidetes bacterium]|nr:hypothetical protein [Bacteroidota bacterium]
MNEFEKLSTLVVSLTQREKERGFKGLNIKSGVGSQSKKVVLLIDKDNEISAAQGFKCDLWENFSCCIKAAFSKTFDKILIY